MTHIQYLERKNDNTLAYVYAPGDDKGKSLPLVMFLGGYRSDMQGTKVLYLEEQCKARGQPFLRFDYSGHGDSHGRFEDGTIGSWLNDALAVFDMVNPQSAVLVGSSMGGWIALLAALQRQGIVKGVIGIAAAPDFTEDLYGRLNAGQQRELEKKGITAIPNDYSDEPYQFTKSFYEEAKAHLLLVRKRPIDFSLRLLQGMQDKDVPWQTALRIQEAFECDQSDITFIEDGDHRLSRPEDLAILDKEVKILSGIK